MSYHPLSARHLWLLFPIIAAIFLLRLNYSRVERIDYLMGIGGGGVAARSAESATGYEGGIRELIIPEHITNSYAWVQTTQQSLAEGELRVRRIDYENAPHGREVHMASPYRWWLSVLAKLHHWFSGAPAGVSVERITGWADPLLHLVLLGIMTFVTARTFGRVAAVVVAMGVAGWFPFAAGFLPGVPEGFTLSLFLSPLGIFALLAGLRNMDTDLPGGKESGGASGWFATGGIIAGLGLWTGISFYVPLILGMGTGGLFAAWAQRRSEDGRRISSTHWRIWSWAGAATVLVGYLLEYFPSHLGGWEMRAVHPIYALAWIGGGELIARMIAWIHRGRSAWTPSGIGATIAALGALASLPFAMWKTANPGYLAFDVLSFRLTKQADGIMASNLWEWISGGGLDATKTATLLPLAFVGLAVWLVFRRATAPGQRAGLLLAMGPAVLAAAIGCQHIRWLQPMVAALLILALAAGATFRSGGWSQPFSWITPGLAALIGAIGWFQLIPPKGEADSNVLTLAELEGLVERDLGHWIARRSPDDRPAVVHAPPSMTTGLSFYGGFDGLASLAWENKDGISAALRVVISTSTDESLALLEQRGVTHIIIPTWDPFWDSYKHSASVQANELFFVTLDRWVLPPWLRPIPYQLPRIPGFEGQNVRVLEVVDPQDEPVAAARLAEYFVEMGQPQNAQLAGNLLKRYPADFGALVARAQVSVATGDSAGFDELLDTLLPRLAGGADRRLLWDRRVSLVSVLARAKKYDLAKEQAEKCVAEMDEYHLRTLTDYSLLHLLRIAKAMGIEFPDPRLRTLAYDLLPPDMRQ